MACVTLKRPLDFDPLHSPSRPPASKRRRCVPIHQRNIDREKEIDKSLSSSSQTSSVFRETPLTPGEIANNLRDELKRLKRRRQLVPYTPGSPGRNGSNPSSPEPMMDSDLAATSSAASVVTSGAGAASTAPTTTTTTSTSTSKPSSTSSLRERPLFTLKQMTLICERMCQERTDKVREEYDRILHQKLSEQYDAFVKFVDHQIQQKFNNSQLPSYLS